LVIWAKLLFLSIESNLESPTLAAQHLSFKSRHIRAQEPLLKAILGFFIIFSYILARPIFIASAGYIPFNN